MSFHQGQIVVRKWSKAKVLKRRLFVVLHQNGRIVNLMDAYGKATQLEYYRVETLDDAKSRYEIAVDRAERAYKGQREPARCSKRDIGSTQVLPKHLDFGMVRPRVYVIIDIRTNSNAPYGESMEQTLC